MDDKPTAMTPRERLQAALTGTPVDRTPVSLYEIDGYSTRYSPDHPSYSRVRQFVRDNCDNMVLETPVIPGPHGFLFSAGNPDMVTVERSRRGGDDVIRTTLRTPRGPLTMETRTRPELYTVWTTEFLLTSPEDVDCLLSVPFEPAAPDFSTYDEMAATLGGRGLMMPDVNDPLVMIATFMAFEDYIMLATVDRSRFRALLDFFAERIEAWLEHVVAHTDSAVYRIVGAELATPPYMPPDWFREFVVDYDTPLVRTIQESGQYARIHCHGNISQVTGMLLEMAPDALDPIEEPPGGDIAFGAAKRILGGDICLMGNIQESMFELNTPEDVAREVRRIKATGERGGRFVLLPTATPLSVPLSARQEENLFAYLETALEN